MDSVVVKMKPVCECGYVFDDLTLTEIKPKTLFSPKFITEPLHSWMFEPYRCPNCNKRRSSCICKEVIRRKNILLYRKGGQRT